MDWSVGLGKETPDNRTMTFWDYYSQLHRMTSNADMDGHITAPRCAFYAQIGLAIDFRVFLLYVTLTFPGCSFAVLLY
jgi:hypothetical protein